MLNTIYTDSEYMSQGFTSEEVPLIRKHDELFNKYTMNGWNITEEQREEFDNLVKILGL